MNGVKNQQGFSLPEVFISMALLSLLFLGAITIYVASLKLTLRSRASVSASTDAALATARLASDCRMAQWVTLPNDAGSSFTQPPGTSVASFTTVDQGNVVNTAAEIVFPTLTTVTVSTGAHSTADVINDRGAVSTPATAGLWIYRSDSDGTPNSSGSCLWMTGSENGTAVNQAIVKSLDPTSTSAVQFSRPASTSAALPYQLEVKVVSSYASPINGAQTSETTDGSQATSLAGRCIQLRNHEPNLDHDPGTTTVTTAPSAPFTSD